MAAAAAAAAAAGWGTSAGSAAAVAVVAVGRRRERGLEPWVHLMQVSVCPEGGYLVALVCVGGGLL